MKRSEINRLIEHAKDFFASHKALLPPFAFFSPEDFEKQKSSAQEIFELRLGWDVTTFGTGEFEKTGLFLFTMRNGQPGSEKYKKAYAEKYMIVREGQITPRHFHWYKYEDIINRGGGNLIMELWKAGPDDKLTDERFTLSVDGIEREFGPGDKLVLTPGESVCLAPYIAHRFYGEPGKGLVYAGEVSMCNDDATDNCFIDGMLRYDGIEEDTDPVHLLVTDYDQFLDS